MDIFKFHQLVFVLNFIGYCLKEIANVVNGPGLLWKPSQAEVSYVVNINLNLVLVLVWTGSTG